MRVIIPVDTQRVTEVIHSNGQVFVNVVMKDGTPKTIRQGK